MTKSKPDKKHQRALSVLLEQGVAAVGLGAACLVVPSFLEPSSASASVAAVLRMAGWLSIGVGTVLLGLRFSVQSKAKKLSTLPRSNAIAGDVPHARRTNDSEISRGHRGFPISAATGATLETNRQLSQIDDCGNKFKTAYKASYRRALLPATCAQRPAGVGNKAVPSLSD